MKVQERDRQMTEISPNEYFGPELRDRVISAYSIPEKYFTEKVKRGLRNSDGTGVMAGVTRIGRVIGYNIEDGEIVPAPGRLYYRGINVGDIVKAHVESGTFGYEEVASLLLMGMLPDSEQFEQFDSILSRARILPDNFTEDMIIKSPSPNVMNKLALLAERGWREEVLGGDAAAPASRAEDSRAGDAATSVSHGGGATSSAPETLWRSPAPLTLGGFSAFWRFVQRFGASLLVEGPAPLRELHREAAWQRVLRFSERAPRTPERQVTPPQTLRDEER